MDLVEAFPRGVAGFAGRVGQVRPEQWTAPTPCPGWDVRTLVNHLVYEQRWSVPILAGAALDEVGSRFDGDLLGDQPVAAVAEAAAAATAAAAEPGALARTVQLSFGDTPATEYLHQLFADHLIHGWDLAAAIGADRRLDPALVDFCAAWFTAREPLYRQSGVIGEPVAVGAGATAQDRLIAAFGRDPGWSPA
jgi:uncharacterized protein (TIGR03086 family)